MFQISKAANICSQTLWEVELPCSASSHQDQEPRQGSGAQGLPKEISDEGTLFPLPVHGKFQQQEYLLLNCALTLEMVEPNSSWCSLGNIHILTNQSNSSFYILSTKPLSLHCYTN